MPSSCSEFFCNRTACEFFDRIPGTRGYHARCKIHGTYKKKEVVSVERLWLSLDANTWIMKEIYVIAKAKKQFEDVKPVMKYIDDLKQTIRTSWNTLKKSRRKRSDEN